MTRAWVNFERDLQAAAQGRLLIGVQLQRLERLHLDRGVDVDARDDLLGPAPRDECNEDPRAGAEPSLEAKLRTGLAAGVELGDEDVLPGIDLGLTRRRGVRDPQVLHDGRARQLPQLRDGELPQPRLLDGPRAPQADLDRAGPPLVGQADGERERRGVDVRRDLRAVAQLDRTCLEEHMVSPQLEGQTAQRQRVRGCPGSRERLTRGAGRRAMNGAVNEAEDMPNDLRETTERLSLGERDKQVLLEAREACDLRGARAPQRLDVVRAALRDLLVHEREGGAREPLRERVERQRIGQVEVDEDAGERRLPDVGPPVLALHLLTASRRIDNRRGRRARHDPPHRRDEGAKLVPGDARDGVLTEPIVVLAGGDGHVINERVPGDIKGELEDRVGAAIADDETRAVSLGRALKLVDAVAEFEHPIVDACDPPHPRMLGARGMVGVVAKIGRPAPSDLLRRGAVWRLQGAGRQRDGVRRVRGAPGRERRREPAAQELQLALAAREPGRDVNHLTVVLVDLALPRSLRGEDVPGPDLRGGIDAGSPAPESLVA
jgi:hypothetical protein